MVSIDPPAPGHVLQEAPPPRDLGALARALADDLGESDPEVRQLLKKLVKRVGWSVCEQTRDDTSEIEASGGLWSVSEKKRRSKGGTFFALLKSRSVMARDFLFAVQDKKGAVAADPPFTWEQRGELVRETVLHRGQVMTAKLTLIGRPEKVVQRQDFVVTSLEYRGAPSLPKGLPLPKSTRTTYTVYIAAKQWRKVAALVQSPEDQLIVEGFCVPDPESGGIAVFAQSVTTKVLQRGKFAEGQEPVAAGCRRLEPGADRSDRSHVGGARCRGAGLTSPGSAASDGERADPRLAPAARGRRPDPGSARRRRRAPAAAAPRHP